MTIKNSHRKNVRVAIEREFEPLLDLIAKYKNGDDVVQVLKSWSEHGTTGEAIAEYLETLPIKPKRKTASKKSATKKDAI